jgi:hypothetical protein
MFIHARGLKDDTSAVEWMVIGIMNKWEEERNSKDLQLAIARSITGSEG